MEERIWFLQIHGCQEGPYSVEELSRDERLTPDTLVWKPGFPTWIAIRNVPELRRIFRDPIAPAPFEEELPGEGGVLSGKDVLALDWYRETPPWLLLILIVLILSAYVWYKS